MKRPFVLLLTGIPVFWIAPFLRAAEEKSLEDHARTLTSLKAECFEQEKRESAMRALARMRSLPAAKVLATVLDDPYVHIQELAVQLLGGMGSAEIASWVAGVVLHDRRSYDLRRNAAEALGLMGRPEAAEGLLRALPDRDAELGIRAARALGRLRGAPAAEGILKALPALRGAPKGEALRALAALGRLPEEKALAAFLKDPAWEVRAGLLDALAAAKAPSAAAFVREGLVDKAPEVRIAAVEAAVALAGGGPEEAGKEALAALEKTLADASWIVRAAAVQSAPALWKTECIPLLIAAMEREVRGGGGRVLFDVHVALRRYSGKSIGFDPELWNAWWQSQKSVFQLGERPKEEEGKAEFFVVPVADEKTSVRFFSIPVLSRRVAFVFDLSGSMKFPSTKEEGAKPKIDVARERLEETMGLFDKDQWFNVIIFRYFSGFPPTTKVERAFPQRLMPADPPRKQAAREFMASMEPKGWGNFYEAILAAMEIPEVDTIYFLSDGKPSRGRYITPEGILKHIAEANRFRRVMIHTILTGEKGTDEKFMRNLAALTWGNSVRG
jgi:HEAT repeat protein